MQTTSQHTHLTKVLKFGFDKDMNFTAVLYGCTECDATSPVPFEDDGPASDHTDHNEYVEGCFACKASTLQLSTGDASSKKAMPQKKWDAELKAYKDARAQGIQPAGTSMSKVREAVDKSDKAGKAFDANTGGFAP